MFMWAIATFTLASVACAAAMNLPQLLAARIVQGLGGAMMVPVGRLILFRGVKREELLQATTWLTMPALVGPLLGPPLGGFLTDALTWRSIFWVNVPVGAVGLLLTWKLLPPSPPESRTPPDLRGMLLSGTSLSLFMISLLSISTFHAATVAGSLFRAGAGAGAGALPFLVPLTLQTGFGYSATANGLVTFASALGSFCMRPMTALALRRFSVRTVLCAGSVCFAAVLLVCSTMSQAWPAAAIFLLLLLGGLGRSLSFATMGALAFADVPRPRLAAATSFQGTAQQLMKAVGVTVAAGTIQATMLVSDSAHTERWQLACGFIATALVVLASLPMFARLSLDAGEGISAPSAKRAERT
ncbi:MFS permease [Candidatus Paraburkholderia kirkii]|nr:MFS permease [Candidatus Paraburkholderia kirkii]